jgi:palmitoyltransferase
MVRSSFKPLCLPAVTLGTDFTSTHWLCLDICGSICASLTLFLHFFSYYNLLVHGLSPDVWGGMDERTGAPASPSQTASLLRYSAIIAATALGALAVTAHVAAMLTNPGAVPANALPLPHHLQSLCTHLHKQNLPNAAARKEYYRSLHAKQCHKCSDNFKPPRSHHCSVTSRCITKLDHFCPWINNAVGVSNHKLFIVFVTWTNVQCAVAFCVVVKLLVECSKKIKNDYDPNAPQDDDWRYNPDLFARPAYCKDHMTTSMYVVLATSVLFWLFTICMLFDQMDAIMRNESKIDRLKNAKPAAAAAVTAAAVVADEDGAGDNNDDDNAGSIKVPSSDGIYCSEIFGGDGADFKLHWLLPFPAVFAPDVRPLIYGYILPDDDYSLESGGVGVDDVGIEMKSIEEGEDTNLLKRSGRGINGADDDGADAV